MFITSLICCQIKILRASPFTKTEFEKAFDDRDELTLWVLKYGLIMHDNNFIFHFYIPSDLTVGEKTILQKRRMIQRLIQDISASRNSTDERIKYKLRRLIFQMARYILLIYKQLPLSRAELPDQLSKYAPKLSQKIMEFEAQDDLSREELLKYFYEIKKTYNQQLRNI